MTESPHADEAPYESQREKRATRARINEAMSAYLAQGSTIRKVTKEEVMQGVRQTTMQKRVLAKRSGDKGRLTQLQQFEM